METEMEFKQIITEDEYVDCLRILNETSNFAEVFQINYYYDDKTFTLYNNGDTLRIRQTGDDLVFQSKVFLEMHNGIRFSAESHQSIDRLPRSIIFNGCLYVYLGNLVTFRKTFNLKGVSVSFDKSQYLGVSDYEIEVETNDDATSTIPDAIYEMLLTKDNTISKYARFVNRLHEISNEKAIHINVPTI